MAALRSFVPFVPSRLSPIGRRNYLRELSNAGLSAVPVAMLEGGVLGVIAKKAFDAPDWAISFIAAAPIFAFLTSVFWARAQRGRDRVRAVNAAQTAVLLVLLVIALAPTASPIGLGVLLVGTLIGRICMAGIITGRADIWRANYPRNVRFSVIGDFNILTGVVVALAGVMLGFAMDTSETAYRIFYPAAAVIGLGGVIIFAGVRWRGGKSFVRRELAADAEGGEGASARAMYRVLREDHKYRQYMIFQFILGIANLSLMPPFIKALDEQFGLEYSSSIMLTATIPIGLMALAIPFWSAFLSRVHIVQFRAIQAWFFVVAIALTAAGVLLHMLALLFLSRIIIGVARGGGALAWNLGHHDFSSREMAPIYMGVHVTLTGVRGVIGPFFGMLLYAGFNLPWLGATTVGQWISNQWGQVGFAVTESGALRVPGAGGWAFAFLALLGFIGAAGFVWQAMTYKPGTPRG